MSRIRTSQKKTSTTSRSKLKKQVDEYYDKQAKDCFGCGFVTFNKDGYCGYCAPVGQTERNIDLGDKLDDIAEELGAVGCQLMELDEVTNSEELGHIIREIGLLKETLEEKAKEIREE